MITNHFVALFSVLITICHLLSFIQAYDYGPSMDSFHLLPCNVIHGVVQCWGYTYATPKIVEKLIQPTFINQDAFGNAKPVKIEDGGYFQIILLDNKKVYGLGSSGDGVFGVNTVDGIQATPVPVQLHSPLSGTAEDLSDVIDIEAGYLHACAVRSDQTLTCWGSDTYGKSSSITQYNGSTDRTRVKHVALGRHETCIVSVDNFVKCFGKESSRFTYQAPSNVIAIEMAKSDHACMLLDQGGNNVSLLE